MKINVFPIASILHDVAVINKETEGLLDEIKSSLKASINVCGCEELYEADLSLILVQSGGSEGKFLELIHNFKEPFYLLTYGSNNSLAASMEILSYLRLSGKDAEILHGSSAYIVKRIQEILSSEKPSIKRLGVIGKPSDWLIASNVDYLQVLKKLNVELIDIDIHDVEKIYSQHYEPKIDYNLTFDELELKKAKYVYGALDSIVKSYRLDGLTVRCFALLNSLKTTSCLGLALLNSSGIIAACEGDIPSMLSMLIAKEVTGTTGFQANPSRVDVNKNEMVFAHCTLPIDMAESYTLDTHYESKIGVAIRAKLKKQVVTIFKLSSDLKRFYCQKAEVIENLNEENLCRTQIKVSVKENIDYFLKNPCGNHHIIVYGDYQKEITEYVSNLMNFN